MVSIGISIDTGPRRPLPIRVNASLTTDGASSGRMIRAAQRVSVCIVAS